MPLASPPHPLLTPKTRQITIDEWMREIAVDNFAGGGGASTGISWALGRSVDIAINHNADAIAMHRANHPTTRHYCESVWDVDPVEAAGGRPVGLGWFSPDCTHHSKARGGKPREKGIRGLAWVVCKWGALVPMRVFMLENVEEFQDWGPLDDNGNPIEERKGETFRAFIACLTTGLAIDHPAWEEIREALGENFPYHRLEQGLGYQVEWRELLACDYGAPTKRKRLFLIGRCDGRPIVWPEPTHGDPKSAAVKSGKLLHWRTAAEIIDWSLECRSIFDRDRPLAENTLRRIARGIQKFVIENPQPFIIRLNYPKSQQRERFVNEPIQTATAKNDLTLVAPTLIQVGYGEREGQAPRALDLGKPLGTIPAGGNKFAVAGVYLDRQFTKSIGQPADTPVNTVTAGGGGKTNLVAAFLAQYHSETDSHHARGQTMDRPILTVDTANRFALVTSHMLKMYGTNIGHRLDEPAHTITAGGFKLGEVRAFLLKWYGSADHGQAADEPLHTITSLARFGIVTIEGEDYQIVDIGMRMLEPRELFNANGFPEDYIIDMPLKRKKGKKDERPSKADQIARCGNAVPPQFSEALVLANCPEMCRDFAAAGAAGD